MLKDIYILQCEDSIVTAHNWIEPAYSNWEYAVWAECQLNGYWRLIIDAASKLGFPAHSRISNPKRLPANWTI